MIPDKSKDVIINALREFDKNLRGTEEWADWNKKLSQHWVIHYEGKSYPPKKIISMATGLQVSSFSGGVESNSYLTKRGFIIMAINSEVTSIQNALESIMAEYSNTKKNEPFSKHNAIGNLFTKVNTLFNSSDLVESRPNLSVKSSYGQGNWAKVPWIAFLDNRETTSTQRGVYVVILFKEDMSGSYITFNQGVTDIIKEHGRPRGHAVLQEKAKKIQQNSLSLQQEGFKLDTSIALSNAGLGHDYEASTIAHKFYQRGSVPGDNQIANDLDALLQVYDNYLSAKQNIGATELSDDNYSNDQTLCLLGTVKHIQRETEKINEFISANGGWASWWSFTLKNRAKELLQPPFYFYINVGGGKFPYRYLVQETETSTGNEGIASPWPDITEELYRGKKALSEKQSKIFKTWLKVKKIEQIDPPLELSDFEPYSSLSNATNLLNQNAFGYAYLKTKELTHKETNSTYSLEEALDGLFINPELFRDILELFHSKKNIILQGPPGVGKTFFSKRLAFALMEAKAATRVEMVQFHQSYSYEDFIQGYRPSGTGFILKNGVFYRFCKRAAADLNNRYVFIIDEINRGNLSKIFGELMMLIESDKRGKEWQVSLTYGDEGDDKFYVPENVYLLGLMNTADRSLAIVDYALRRRFGFIDLSPGFSTQAFQDFLSSKGADSNLTDSIVKKMTKINDEIARDKTNLGPGYCIGHSFFCSIPLGGEPNIKWFNNIIKSEIAPLLKEYWFDDHAQAESLINGVLLAD